MKGLFYKFQRDSLSLGPGLFSWTTVQISYYSMHKRHESEKLTRATKDFGKSCVQRVLQFCAAEASKEPQENRRLKSDTTWPQVDLTRQWLSSAQEKKESFSFIHGELPFLFNFQNLSGILSIFFPHNVKWCPLLYLKHLPFLITVLSQDASLADTRRVWRPPWHLDSLWRWLCLLL